MSGVIDLDVIAGAKSTHKFARLSASKVRVVLDLIRDDDLDRARDSLEFCARGAADVVSKVLESAVANAEHNEHLSAEELYVAECWADEGPTLKRWRPRARGRATRINKQTCHITVVVAQLDEAELGMRAARQEAAGTRGAAATRAARVAASRDESAEGSDESAEGSDEIVEASDESAEGSDEIVEASADLAEVSESSEAAEVAGVIEALADGDGDSAGDESAGDESAEGTEA